MRHNLWTMLSVFVAIFALAWFLNRGKTESAARQAWAAGRSAHTREQPAQPAPTMPFTQGHSGGDGMPGGSPASAWADAQSRGDNEAHAASRKALTADTLHSPMAPAADSIRRNPPNGMVFAGSGRYQLYRQGDITWRLDTDTGQACVLFATDRQWRLARVFKHGCGETGRS